MLLLDHRLLPLSDRRLDDHACVLLLAAVSVCTYVFSLDRPYDLDRFSLAVRLNCCPISNSIAEIN
jgi:hypothetical protein